MAIKNKKFTVNAVVRAWIGIEITAISLEEAIEKSKKLQIDDFITIDSQDEHIDSNLKIQSISDNSTLDNFDN